jgi:hypothetical protein
MREQTEQIEKSSSDLAKTKSKHWEEAAFLPLQTTPMHESEAVLPPPRRHARADSCPLRLEGEQSGLREGERGVGQKKERDVRRLLHSQAQETAAEKSGEVGGSWEERGDRGRRERARGGGGFLTGWGSLAGVQRRDKYSFTPNHLTLNACVEK